MTNEQEIIALFETVRSRGFVKSNRRNNTGIGKTFEDYIGVPENNLDAPDLLGYEIKAHRELSSSYVTLFTKSPSFPRQANHFLKELFGVPYEDNPILKRLHTSMFADHGNNYYNQLSFRLVNDAGAQKIFIEVSRLGSNEILDASCGYTYSDIQKVLSSKLKKLFYVTAENQHRADGEWFHYTKADIYEEPTFENFLTMLNEGEIMYDIRIGSYQSGANFGKPHDHGSGFRVKEDNIKRLYSRHIEI